MKEIAIKEVAKTNNNQRIDNSIADMKIQFKRSITERLKIARQLSGSQMIPQLKIRKNFIKICIENAW